MFVAGLDTGYIAKCSLFNVLAFSRLSWLASFIEPPPAVMLEVRNAVNRLSRGPWNAFPYKFAKNLKSIGCKIQINDLKMASIAGRVRNALCTATCFGETQSRLQLTLVGMERIPRVPQREWLEGSINYNMQNAINIVLPIFPTICSDGLAERPSQHEVHSALMDQANDTYAFKLLCKRLPRFFPGLEDCATYISHVIKKYQSICKTHSHTIVIAHMRAILNQWSTAHRYGLVQRCEFCSEHADKLEHILVCPKLHRILALAMSQHNLRPSLEVLLLFRHHDMPISVPLVRYCMIWLCIAFNCHNSCRHGKSFNLRLARFHMKRLATRCNKCRNDIIWYRSVTLNLPTSNQLPAIALPAV